MGWLGIIADDITGASDVASALRVGGLVVSLVLDEGMAELPEADAWVIAMTTRQAPVDEAVGRSVAAVRKLLAAGATTIYTKYCSTFDSTPQGNIGPIGDALLELAEAHGGRPSLVQTPATPRVGRIQRGPLLYVNGVPLAESPMKDHPLTPMRESDLTRLLQAQSTRPVSLVQPCGEPPVGHALVAAASEDELDQIADWLLALPPWPQTITGGAAGLAGALARRRPGHAGEGEVPEVTRGRRMVLAGSCSAMTRAQVATFTGPALRVEADAAMADQGLVERLLAQAEEAWSADEDAIVLISSTTEPERARADQERHGRDALARAIERTMGRLAVGAVREHGVTRLVTAGGETSGAVTMALGIESLWVGPDVAPGVPWCVSPDGLAVLLKSGNFGTEDLFETAFRSAP